MRRPDFDEIAEALYGLPPGEFTARRDAYAAEARGAGERDLALAVKSLKRPTNSAWLANGLVRECRQQVLALVELGAAMRAAQARLAGDDLRRLSQQRRHLIAILASSARQLASGAGLQVSLQAEAELESTLEVASADPARGGVLLAGRLSAALKASELGSFDLSETAMPMTDPIGRTTSSRRAGKTAHERDEPPRADRRQERAARVVAEAETVVLAARAELVEQTRRESAAEQERRRLRAAISKAAAQLDALQVRQADATRELQEARHGRAAAERVARLAERRLAEARRALDRLGD
ncbi:MAG TPA: hypothetical protein VEH29_17915 [Acidimicrobiales bacterium]|nr:hypothetical protein [Acidimicrobiales bacterium]